MHVDRLKRGYVRPVPGGGHRRCWGEICRAAHAFIELQGVLYVRSASNELEGQGGRRSHRERLSYCRRATSLLGPAFTSCWKHPQVGKCMPTAEAASHRSTANESFFRGTHPPTHLASECHLIDDEIHPARIEHALAAAAASSSSETRRGPPAVDAAATAAAAIAAARCRRTPGNGYRSLSSTATPPPRNLCLPLGQVGIVLEPL